MDETERRALYSDERNTLTAGELIDALRELPPDTPLQGEVSSEGQFGFCVVYRAPGQSSTVPPTPYDWQEPVIIAAADPKGNPL